jgi:hypothetical protein
MIKAMAMYINILTLIQTKQAHSVNNTKLMIGNELKTREVDRANSYAQNEPSTQSQRGL